MENHLETRKDTAENDLGKNQLSLIKFLGVFMTFPVSQADSEEGL